MKITEDVREYAAQKEIDEQTALGVRMEEKAEGFVASGREINDKVQIPMAIGLSHPC